MPTPVARWSPIGGSADRAKLGASLATSRVGPMSPYHRILVIGGARFRLPPVAQLADILRQAPRAALWRPPGSPCPSRSKEAGYRRALLTETHRRGQARWCAQFQPRFARCLRAVSVARCSHRWCCSSPPMRAERLTSERVAEEDRATGAEREKGRCHAPLSGYGRNVGYSRACSSFHSGRHRRRWTGSRCTAPSSMDECRLGRAAHTAFLQWWWGAQSGGSG
jgi:hypothetical protein